MPTLDALNDTEFFKGLLIGDSGTGKTGALASLALAGYKLRILDFDKGIQPIKHAILKAGKPEALKNVEFVALDDKYRIVNGKAVPDGVPTAFSTGLNMLNYWGPKHHKEAADLGDPAKWGRDTFLIWDSLTHSGKAAMRYVQVMANHAGNNPTQPEWGASQQMLESALAYMCSAQFKTNILVLSHVDYRQDNSSVDDKGEPNGPLKGWPMALGKALPPQVASYFNIMLYSVVEGSGPAAKRWLCTTPTSTITAKNPILTGVPAKLPIETGLAQYVGAVLGTNPPTQQVKE